MTDYFDDSHVTDVGLEGSAGPAVGYWDLITQSFRQQYHVNSELALDEELRNRWSQSLEALRTAGQNFNAPANPLMYRGYANFVRNGTPVTMPTVEGGDPSRGPYGQFGARINYDAQQPNPEFQEMQRADEAIRRLNNPNIKTFEQILDEVGTMQRGIEEQSASMHERGPTGTFLAELLGGAAGSFTQRDPLNIVTAPIGAGRRIAMKIATDMAVAGGVTAVTEFGDVQPNRALAELPERNPYFDILAAGIGAGLIRGGLIEPAAHGLKVLSARRLAAEEAGRFDLRDTQLREMFGSLDDSPTARAAGSLLDDTVMLEHANPYGEGEVAGFRWHAELEATARAINGEETSPVELPPVPSEYVERALSFQSVKETAPDLWNELDAARTRLNELDNTIEEVSTRQLSIPDAVRLVDEEAGAKLDQLSEIVNNLALPEGTRAAADMEARAIVLRTGADKIMNAVNAADIKAKHELRSLRASRKAANKQYRAAYQKVDREAQRLELAEAAKRVEAQSQSINVLGPHAISEPLTGPMTRHDFVETHVARVEETDKAIPEASEAVNDLKIDPETETVDIGTRTPVSADFKVPLEDGEMSVREILDDLAEDKRLEEAVKGCAL